MLNSVRATPEVIASLLRNRVPEGRLYEYKQSLPGSSDRDVKEFLADVSSFANSSGGTLLFGIREEGGVPVELSGREIQDIDAEILRLDALVRDGIEPRIPGIHIAPISLSSNQTGTMGLSIIELPSQATTRSLAVAVRNGTAEFTAILEVDEEGRLVESTDSASFLAALASAINSQEGQEVEESATFAAEQLAGMAMGDLVSGLLTQSQPLNSLPMTEIDELNGAGDCARSILFSIYGASLAIYGCTGDVGWLGASVVEKGLVYARTLQQIWNTCRVATW